MKRKGSCFRILGWTTLGVVLLVAGAALYLFWPVNAASFASHPNPLVNYEVAVGYVNSLYTHEAALGTQFNPLCKAQLLTHGQRTAQVVVLVHGYTNCPNQYRTLAQQIFNQGYNVLLVPLPHHGWSDRMNTDHANLTAEELAEYADQVVDIAHGLGDHVTMIGISAGGVTTAWAAQHRPDLDRAIIISPMFGFKIVPTPLTSALMRFYLIRPNSFSWWNDQEMEEGGPDYAYPRYSTHALAQALRLGLAVMGEAGREPFQAKSLVVVTNANDQNVNNEMTARAFAAWSKTNPGKISAYQFPAELKLGHDIIDPSDKDGDIEVVYPKLIELIQAP